MTAKHARIWATSKPGRYVGDGHLDATILAAGPADPLPADFVESKFKGVLYPDQIVEPKRPAKAATSGVTIVKEDTTPNPSDDEEKANADQSQEAEPASNNQAEPDNTEGADAAATETEPAGGGEAADVTATAEEPTSKRKLFGNKK